MTAPIWQIQFGDQPLVAAAIHDGHEVRADLQERLALSAGERLREEDPFTGVWTSFAATRIVGMRSRFEVDLNRPREKAVYQTPEDAWGLAVWRGELPIGCVEQSLAEYDSFYSSVRNWLHELTLKHGCVVVFDLHTYNHRRQGPNGPPADTTENPEVNIGTGTMDRKRWAPIVDSCINSLRSFDYLGRRLDVRENVKFRGGNFSRWIHEQFPETVCSIAIEFKKFFMDEWTGEPDQQQITAIGNALHDAADGITKELATVEQIETD